MSVLLAQLATLKLKRIFRRTVWVALRNAAANSSLSNRIFRPAVFSISTVDLEPSVVNQDFYSCFAIEPRTETFQHD